MYPLSSWGLESTPLRTFAHSRTESRFHVSARSMSRVAETTLALPVGPRGQEAGYPPARAAAWAKHSRLGVGVGTRGFRFLGARPRNFIIFNGDLMI